MAGRIVDSEPPTVSINNPGSPVSGTVSLSANASDNEGVTKVEFYYDGNRFIGTDTSAPYSVNWDTKGTSNGSHSLTAKAFDATGNSAVSSPVNVTVDNPVTIPPTVSITQPLNGSFVRGNLNI